jgi:hypothetical protein
MSEGLNVNDIAGGGKAWSPEDVGDKITGIITLIERRPQRAFDGGGTLTWDDGSPRLLTYIEMETTLQETDDDDGVRALYLKGGRNFEPAIGTGHSGEVALVEAAKKAGLSTIESGCKLSVVHSGVAKPTTRGYQGAKLYTMKLEAPTSSVAVDDLFDD